MITYFIDNDLKISSAILRISGADANRYLQGRLTQDLRLPIGGCCYGLWLNEKGRVQADSHVLRTAENENVVISLGCDAREFCLLVERNLIADEVEIEEFSTQGSLWIFLSDLLSPEFAKILLPQGVPKTGSFLSYDGAYLWLSHWPCPGSLLMFVSREAEPRWRVRVGQMQGQRLDWAELERARLRCGVPTIPIDIGPADFPGEGGLDDVAVSYAKGCYLGQEVMARLKNLGQLRRRLHVVRGTGAAPAPASPVFQAGRRVGELRSVVQDGDAYQALAMLTLLQLDPSAGLALAADAGVSLHVVRSL